VRRPIALGYRAIDRRHVAAGPWLVSAGGAAVEDPDVLEGWDYFTTIAVSRTLRVDVEAIWTDCQLADDARLAVRLGWRSTWTGLRGFLSAVDVTDTCDLTGTIPGQILGGRVELSTVITCARPGRGPGVLAPRRPGNVLWSDRRSVAVEGIGTRVPTVAVDFRQAGLGGTGSGGWQVQVLKEDLDQAAGASVRVFLNTANAAVKMMLEQPATAAAHEVAASLRIDFARSLVAAALEAENLDPMADYEDDSLGAVLLTTVRAWFPSEDLGELRSEWRLDPGAVESRLQGRLGYP